MTDNENCNFHSKSITVRVRQSLMSHHERKQANFHMCFPIGLKIHTIYEASTEQWQSWMNSIVPPSGERKIILVTICSVFHQCFVRST